MPRPESFKLEFFPPRPSLPSETRTELQNEIRNTESTLGEDFRVLQRAMLTVVRSSEYKQYKTISDEACAAWIALKLSRVLHEDGFKIAPL